MKTSHENYLEELNDSPMLYLSAGSKELFHSNFLYWLSNSNWNAFIHVLCNLAGLGNNEHFWWEESYSLKNENLTVRREYHHFDLSIYVRIHTNKWVPVLVLENKMKSLPYPEQLINYSAKAKKEWGKTENNGKGKITFILLSLTDATSLRKEPNLKTWSFKKYIDLANVLKNWPNRYTGFHRQLYENYCRFIRVLSMIVENWGIHDSDKYLAHICPGALSAEDKRTFQKAYDEYRILCNLSLNDIWQKVSFDRLSLLLDAKLSNKGIRCSHFRRDKKSGFTPGFHLNTGYTRDTGLIELRYVLEDNPKDEEPVSVLIQIQGKQYRYAVTTDKIIRKDSDGQINPNWERIIDSVQTPSEITRNKIERWATQAPMSGKNSWCRYGDSFIYRYRHINPSETISDIIDNIVNDAQEILNLFGK